MISCRYFCATAFSGIFVPRYILLWIWQHIIDAEYSVTNVLLKYITLDMTIYHILFVVTLDYQGLF